MIFFQPGSAIDGEEDISYSHFFFGQRVDEAPSKYQPTDTVFNSTERKKEPLSKDIDVVVLDELKEELIKLTYCGEKLLKLFEN